jgi:hypothetical protein
MIDHMKSAKSFCATFLPMLNDKQYARTVAALAKLLETTYVQGHRHEQDTRSGNGRPGQRTGKT